MVGDFPVAVVVGQGATAVLALWLIRSEAVDRKRSPGSSSASQA